MTVRRSDVVHIKKMVCPRCIETVKEIFIQLNIPFGQIKLGEVTVQQPLTPSQKETLEKQLIAKGFELLNDRTSKLITQIKTIIIEQIHYNDEPLRVNFSTLISNKLHQDYSSLSKLFSSTEGTTIEKFILSQKIEKVKELIFYNEFSLSEIAFKMNYSSAAHLSNQFKKETGMTPTEFKKLQSPNRKSLDSI